MKDLKWGNIILSVMVLIELILAVISVIHQDNVGIMLNLAKANTMLLLLNMNNNN